MFSFKENINLSGYTLIIPSVSVGNIPQLTVDLLITTYNFKKIATIWHPAIVPSVGGDPYESNKSEICTACELYICENLKIAAIQLRSTLDYKLTLKYFNDLKQQLVSFKLKNVLILSSAFDYQLHKISTEKFFYSSNEQIEDVMKGMNINPIDIESNDTVPGSGYGLKLYEILSPVIKCSLLIKYGSEGDNRPDALMMLEKLSRLAGLSKENVVKLTFPTSWKFVFGGPPPEGIY